MTGPLAALYLDWALTALWPIVGKRALLHFDPLTFGTSGLALAVAVLLPALWARGRLGLIFSPALRGPLFMMGLFASGAPTFLFLYGVARTTPANAAIVCQVEVVYSAVLASLVLGEVIRARQAAASALVLAGTALILWKDLGTPHWSGDIVFLATPWMFQVSHILSKRLPPDLDSVTIAGGRAFYGFLTLAPFAAWSALSGRAHVSWSHEAAGLLLLQGLVMVALNHTLWYMALRRLPLAKTTAIMLSYPALTMVYSWLLGTEAIGAYQVAGLITSMGGALWLTRQAHGEVELMPETTP